MYRIALLALVAASLLSSGCGTVANFALPSEDPKTFGGIRRDIDVIDKLVQNNTADPSGPLSSAGPGAALLAVGLLVVPFADLPLSFVGDALTYPLARWLDDR